MTFEEIVALLPEVFRRSAERGTPLAALIESMEGLHAPAEEALARFPARLGPWSTDPAFLELLASWVHVEPGLARDEASLRALVEHAAALWRQRGTKHGLLALLERATGVRGFALIEGERPFHIRVRVPAAAGDNIPRLQRIIALMKPAAVTYDLDLLAGDVV